MTSIPLLASLLSFWISWSTPAIADPISQVCARDGANCTETQNVLELFYELETTPDQDRVQIGQQCWRHKDCPESQACVSNRCQAKSKDICRESADCQASSLCLSGRCVVRGSWADRCFSSFDCPESLRCVNQRCSTSLDQLK